MNRDSISVKLDDTYALHVRSGYPARANVANSYRCSIGPRPGEAFVLMDKRNATRLSSRSSHSLEFHSTGSGVTLDITGLYWHSAVKLSTGVGDNSLYLIRLYDKRILACRYSDSQTVLANVRGGAIAYTSPYVAGSGETWQDVVDALWPSILGTAPTLPYTPAGDPEGQWHGQNAWWALHSVLTAIGCTTVYDPTTGEFEIVRVGEAQTWEEPDIPIWDADPIGGQLDAPATIAGYFSDWSEQHGTEPETLTAGNNYIETPPYGRETLATGAEAVDGTVLPRWAPFPQVSSYEGTDRNSGDRTDWLNQEKLNILNDTSTPRRHKQFNGVHKILPGSEIKTVQWHHRGECGGMVTEYASHPGDPLPGGSGTAVDCYAPAYVEQNWQVPTFAAAGYPTWPRVSQVVEIRHGGGASNGDTVSANSDNLHPGRLLRHDHDSVETSENVWVRIIDEYSTNSGDVDAIEGEQFVGRLCGMASSGGSKKPLYVARKGTGSASTPAKLIQLDMPQAAYEQVSGSTITTYLPTGTGTELSHNPTTGEVTTTANSVSVINAAPRVYKGANSSRSRVVVAVPVSGGKYVPIPTATDPFLDCVWCQWQHKSGASSLATGADPDFTDSSIFDMKSGFLTSGSAVLDSEYWPHYARIVNNKLYLPYPGFYWVVLTATPIIVDIGSPLVKTRTTSSAAGHAHTVDVEYNQLIETHLRPSFGTGAGSQTGHWARSGAHAIGGMTSTTQTTLNDPATAVWSGTVFVEDDESVEEKYLHPQFVVDFYQYDGSSPTCKVHCYAVVVPLTRDWRAEDSDGKAEWKHNAYSSGSFQWWGTGTEPS